MAHRLLALLAALLVLAAAATPAWAITYGQPDGNGHPYVGAVVFYEQGSPARLCSGTLLSSTVLVTAAHCAGADGTPARVWFDASLAAAPGFPLSGGVSGTARVHPGWTGAIVLPNSYDIAVVELDSPVSTAAVGQLPPLGYLDQMARRRGQSSASFTVVGYGAEGIKPQVIPPNERRVATLKLVSLESALTDGFNVQLTSAPGTGGGTCLGDSGAPVLHGDSTVVGVISGALNALCKGTVFAYRTDTPAAQSFLRPFLP